MLDDQQLEYHVRELLIDICEVLYHRGYETVPVGAVMRLIGVSSERACLHDNEYYALDSEFQSILAARKNKKIDPPQGVTLH
jgi:hypothetical protein